VTAEGEIVVSNAGTTSIQQRATAQHYAVAQSIEIAEREV
jgi:hypothetical protein